MGQDETLESYLDHVKQTVNQDKEPGLILDELVAMSFRGNSDTSLSVNNMTFINYMSDLRFGWDNYEIDEIHDAPKVIQKIKDLIRDIENGNQYTLNFYVSSIYSERLPGDKYDVKVTKTQLDTHDINEAKIQANDIRRATPRELPESPKHTLDDVILKMETVNNKGERVVDIESVEVEHGIYFKPE